MTPRVSVAIMAHPRRADFVPELEAALDRPATVVWDDGSNSRWGTGRRALLAYDPAATHHLVVQDDAVIPRDLVAGVETALQHAPQDVPLCLYVGRVRPYREMVTEYVGRAAEGASWLVMDRLNWGVAVVLPVSLIEAMVAACDTQSIPNYDSRMSAFFEDKGIEVWYPWPSPVNHRESPSLVPGRVGAGRVAHRFIGATTSALDIDYSGAVLRLPNADSYRPGGQTTMLFISEKYNNLSIPTVRVRFKDHYFMASTPGQISYLQRHFMKARGVRPATEEETAAWHERQQAGAVAAAVVREPTPVEPPVGAEEVKEPAPDVSPEDSDAEKVAEPAPASPEADDEAPADEQEDPAEPEGNDEDEPVIEVPDGTATEILAWVGADVDRAKAAAEAEVTAKQRKTLLADLDKIIGE